MGWNSWDSYGLTITEAQFRANVEVQGFRLRPFGWTYAVIDEGWFMVNPEDRPHPEQLKLLVDANGRYIPTPGRFPSSASDQGFKALGDWVHEQGLKFGIHIVRGIPRTSVEQNLPIAGSAFKATDAADTSDPCPWDPTNWGVRDTPAGQAWYDSLLAQYSAWGIDLIKVDCIADHPYKVSEIRQLRVAIDKTFAKTGRSIVLSLSPGPTNLEHAAEVGSLAQMWRISDDIWDFWVNPKPFPQSVSSQFARAAAWAQYAKPGNWPDADMLPLGHLGPTPGEGKDRTTRLTPVEQQTMVTLWSMARSPLILGANLTLLDDDTFRLLTNREVLRIDQTATASREVLHAGEVIAWTADLPSDYPGGYTRALAIFNLADTPVTINSAFEAYNLNEESYHAHDAWTGKSLGKLKAVEGVSLAGHASTLWLLHK